MIMRQLTPTPPHGYLDKTRTIIEINRAQRLNQLSEIFVFFIYFTAN
ncbi:hypothetical protein AC26_3785 [Escherichia coli 1-176-05_S3_C2]|nr:hypothetical protein AC26_3785 [Escherichia coli 1-176-05_S3_C2]